MATIKKPRTDDAVTAQTEGGKHPRGVASKSYARQEGPPAASGRPAGRRAGAGGYGAGKHFRDNAPGPSDLERNPGIGSSKGTGSGESGIEERDEGAGPGPRRR